jgi:hypothetical protein
MEPRVLVVIAVILSAGQSAEVDEVRQAIADLDRQRTQVRLSGRTFLLDVVMQAPERFSPAVRTALEAELPTLRPAVLRSRFHFREPVRSTSSWRPSTRSTCGNGTVPSSWPTTSART